MNRLVLIGNGFDVAHGLKTSYKDFITDYFCDAINEFYKNSIYSDEFFDISTNRKYNDVTIKGYEEVQRFFASRSRNSFIIKQNMISFLT